MFSLVISLSIVFTLLGQSQCQTYSYHNTGASIQLFEWSWADVANECEQFLSKKGYKAVQVSPPMEHITGPHYI